MPKKSKPEEVVEPVQLVEPVEPETPVFECSPPTVVSRNDYGLLTNINYKFLPNGFVDWRSMVEPQYLVPNRINFQRRQQEVPTSIEGVEDKDLLILLGGFKQLAKIRGFTNVKHEVILGNDESVIVKTKIDWIPNFETNYSPVRYESVAQASLMNTDNFARNYLASIAENRGFARAVRNFLEIPINGQDEISEAGTPEEPVSQPSIEAGSPLSYLESALKENNLSFEKFKNGILDEGVEEANEWLSINDIPPDRAFDVLVKIKERIARKKAEKSSK